MPLIHKSYSPSSRVINKKNFKPGRKLTSTFKGKILKLGAMFLNQEDIILEKTEDLQIPPLAVSRLCRKTRQLFPAISA